MKDSYNQNNELIVEKLQGASYVLVYKSDIN